MGATTCCGKKDEGLIHPEKKKEEDREITNVDQFVL